MSAEQQPRQTENSEWLRILLPIIILACGGVAVYILTLMAPSPEQKPEEEKLIETVRTVPAVLLREPLTLEADGTVVPLREVNLAAEVSGTIVFKDENCRAGRFVNRGDIICKIDPLDYTIAKRQLEQQHEQTDATIKEIEVDAGLTKELIELGKESLELLKKEHSRLVELGENDVVSDAQIEVALRGVIQSRNALLTLEKQVRTMEVKLISADEGRDLIEVQLEKAEADLKRATVRSPVSGVIVADLVEAGDFVNRGTPLASIEDTSAVEVLCHLRLDQLQWLWDRGDEESTVLTIVEQPESTPPKATEPSYVEIPGTTVPSDDDDSTPPKPVEPTETTADGIEPQMAIDADFAKEYEIPPLPAEIEFSLAGRKYIWQGRLSRYDGIGLNPKTRTIPIRVLIEDPRKVEIRDEHHQVQLKPPALIREMFVKVRVKIETDIPLFKVPETALRPGTEKQIWVVREGKLVFVKIKVVETLDEKFGKTEANTIIVRPLEDGSLMDNDQVIVSPLSYASPGISLKIYYENAEENEEFIKFRDQIMPIFNKLWRIEPNETTEPENEKK